MKEISRRTRCVDVLKTKILASVIGSWNTERSPGVLAGMNNAVGKMKIDCYSCLHAVLRLFQNIYFVLCWLYAESDGRLERDEAGSEEKA